MIVAILEEFITQGVLKRNPLGWIIPTFIAFLPFLLLASQIRRVLLRRIGREARLDLEFYLVSGTIGLAVEWFLIGLAPWNLGLGTDPFLSIVFQIAMFSFWGSVAFVPKIILDRRQLIIGSRRWLRRFLVIGFASIYFVTFASGRTFQFEVGILSVMVFFLSLNLFFAKYLRTEGTPQQGPSKAQGVHV